jgi:hypothetical protein
MSKFNSWKLKEGFARFERAAAKGHEESIWILSVVKDVEMEKSASGKAFAKTEEPLGDYFAGQLSYGTERFDFMKKSAEGGCSWGQVQYGDYGIGGHFLERDDKHYLEWLEKGANQNNPQAMEMLGFWFRGEGEGNDMEKALAYFYAAAELGWGDLIPALVYMLKGGVGCEKDLRQAVIWSARGNYDYRGGFWDIMEYVQAREDLECDFDQLCYSMGWGLYWHLYCESSRHTESFTESCLDYYCSCVELQQKSIFTFLWCWNRTMGVKDMGLLIGKMVWEGREDNLVKEFEWKQEGWGCVLF